MKSSLTGMMLAAVAQRVAKCPHFAGVEVGFSGPIVSCILSKRCRTGCIWAQEKTRYASPIRRTNGNEEVYHNFRYCIADGVYRVGRNAANRASGCVGMARQGGRTWAVWGSGAQVAWVLCGRAANKQAPGHLILELIAYRKPPVLKPTNPVQTPSPPVSNPSGIPLLKP